MRDWERYLENDDEGLGTVYERFVLNRILLGYRKRYGFDRAIEAPIYGMTGLTGINGAELVREGCALTLVDTDQERAEGTERAWTKIGLPGKVDVRVWNEGQRLPFKDREFPFAFNFAAMWHLRDGLAFLRELTRVSSRHVFLAMPNPLQLGYFMRKKWLEPNFFDTVDERWTKMPWVKQTLGELGFAVVDEGVFDVPPWPDTCLPVAELLARMGLKRRPKVAALPAPAARKNGWSWSIVSYYRDGDLGVKKKVDRLQRLGPEGWPIPWQMKLVWAHHRCVLAERRG